MPVASFRDTFVREFVHHENIRWIIKQSALNLHIFIAVGLIVALIVMAVVCRKKKDYEKQHFKVTLRFLSMDYTKLKLFLTLLIGLCLLLLFAVLFSYVGLMARADEKVIESQLRGNQTVNMFRHFKTKVITLMRNKYLSNSNINILMKETVRILIEFDYSSDEKKVEEDADTVVKIIRNFFDVGYFYLHWEVVSKSYMDAQRTFHVFSKFRRKAFHNLCLFYNSSITETTCKELLFEEGKLHFRTKDKLDEDLLKIFFMIDQRDLLLIIMKFLKELKLVPNFEKSLMNVYRHFPTIDEGLVQSALSFLDTVGGTVLEKVRVKVSEDLDMSVRKSALSSTVVAACVSVLVLLTAVPVMLRCLERSLTSTSIVLASASGTKCRAVTITSLVLLGLLSVLLAVPLSLVTRILENLTQNPDTSTRLDVALTTALDVSVREQLTSFMTSETDGFMDTCLSLPRRPIHTLLAPSSQLCEWSSLQWREPGLNVSCALSSPRLMAMGRHRCSAITKSVFGAISSVPSFVPARWLTDLLSTIVRGMFSDKLRNRRDISEDALRDRAHRKQRRIHSQIHATIEAVRKLKFDPTRRHMIDDEKEKNRVVALLENEGPLLEKMITLTQKLEDKRDDLISLIGHHRALENAFRFLAGDRSRKMLTGLLQYILVPENQNKLENHLHWTVLPHLTQKFGPYLDSILVDLVACFPPCYRVRAVTRAVLTDLILPWISTIVYWLILVFALCSCFLLSHLL